MGKNDIYLKRYLSDKRRFADLFNAVICRGEEIFTPEDIRGISETSPVVLLAVENQEEIHYAMPVRSMLYDALNYTEQVERIAKENWEKKRVKRGGEYLSGIRKCDKLAPVITFS